MGILRFTINQMIASQGNENGFGGTNTLYLLKLPKIHKIR